MLCIVIEPPTNTWKSNTSNSLKKSSRKLNIERGKDTVLPHLPFHLLHLLCLLREEAESQRSQSVLFIKEDADLLLLNLFKTMVGIKE